MARFDYRTLTPAQRVKLNQELLEIIAAIKTKGDLEKFLLQLITPSEMAMLARRWQIAKRLAAGESYDAIAQKLKIGMSTIQSVDRWLSETIGNYREKLKKERAKLERRRLRERLPTNVRFFPNALPFLLLNVLLAALYESSRKKLNKDTANLKA
jgi:uncharacterized protein YerC